MNRTSTRNAGKVGEMSVVVEVDFGPAERTSESWRVMLPQGATALDATLKAVPTDQGTVCCDPKNVFAICGVACDPPRRMWWFYFVNDHPGPRAAHLVPVADGDVIQWRYMSEQDWRKVEGSFSARHRMKTAETPSAS